MERSIEKLSKDLLFYIANQREKVPSVLSTLLPRLYPDYNEEQIFEIRNRILKNISSR